MPAPFLCRVPALAAHLFVGLFALVALPFARAQAPSITFISGPRQVIAKGQPVSLTVSASGTGPLSYQWKRNGVAVPGATTSTVTFTTAAAARDNGYYQAVVSNTSGAVTSPTVFVNISYPSTQVVAWGSNNGGEMDLPGGLTSVVAVAAGNWHGMALKSDGTVVGWGSGTGSSVPVGLNNVVAIAAGQYFAIALKADGTVVTWGNNGGPPAVPAGLNSVVAVAGGSSHALALKSDGTVVQFVASSYSGTLAAVPTGLGGVVSIAAGYNHSVAVKADGSVVTWGSSYSVPANLIGVVAVAAQNSTSIAARADGGVVVWGDTSFGLGNIPTGLTGVVSVALGFYQAVALKSDGMIIVWGDNYNVSIPNPPNIGGVVAVAAGPGLKLALRDSSNDLAPTVLTPPVSVAANLGQRVVFNVTATAGTASLSYQWRRNGTNIAGATAASYAIDETVASSVGDYDVVVSNPLGSVQSTTAQLSLNVAPVVSATTGGRYPLTLGQSLTLTLSSAIGTATIQWKLNGRPIAGATGRNFTVANATLAQSGAYQAIYDTGSGPVASAAIFVMVAPAATQVIAWGGIGSESSVAVPSGLSTTVAVAARGSSSLALQSDGTLVRWGAYSYSEYGVPTGLGNVVGMALANSRYLALKADGSVVMWGSTPYYTETPMPANLTGVISVAAGDSHFVALKGDGTVAAWGASDYGATAVPAGLTNVSAIAAGVGYTLALRNDGTVIGWGNNSYRQSAVPADLTNVVAIAAGSTHSLALKSDGTVVAWGYNGSGQATVPAGLTGVVAIAAGDSHSLALKADGTVVGWGNNSYGQISVPPGFRQLFMLAAGYSHSVGLRDASADTAPTITLQPASVTAFTGQSPTFSVGVSGGTAALSYQWRKNGAAIAGATASSVTLVQVASTNGGSYDVIVTDQLGFAASAVATLTVNSTPAVTLNPAGRRSIARGQSLTLTGTAAIPGPITYQWLRNGLPIAGATNAAFTIANAAGRDAGVYRVVATNSVGPALSTPAFVGVSGYQIRAWGDNTSGKATIPSGLGAVVAVSAGSGHSLALLSDGTVAAWGANTSGELDIPAGLSDVVAIAAGAGFSMALRGDGTVVTWGAINFTPSGLSDVVAIAANNSGSSSYSYYSFALAVKGDGTVVGWNTTNVTPDMPTGGVVAADAGTYSRVVLKSDGTVVQSGDSNLVVPANLTGVIAIAAGDSHTLALKSDGTVVAWGTNYQGETTIPAGLSGVVAIAAGSSTSLAIKADGTVVGWGYLSYHAGAVSTAPAVAISIGYNHGLALRDPSGDVAPIITTQPTNQVAITGGTVSLSVVATGTPPPTFQWLKDGVAIGGATSAVLSLTNIWAGTAGSYSVTVTNSLGSITSNAVTLTVTPTLSSRGLLTSATRANAGPAALFGTFTIEGTVAKLMLVRAVGPALAGFGVSGVLADPQLTITTPAGTVIATNDNWGLAANASLIASTSTSVGAFALPIGGKDAAILRTYSPGTYHVRATGVGGSAGVGMLEIYDVDSNPRLVYLSTSGFAGTGADVLVQGITLADVPPGRSYLVRALGPSLTTPAALADPRLAIFNAAGVQVAANDDWGGDSGIGALAAKVGAMALPVDSKDAAVNFLPTAGGVYTVQVAGAGGATGMVLLEIFEADDQRGTIVPAAVVSPPQNVAVLAGQPATMGVVTIGKPAPTYQWSKNGTAIAGATQATLSFASVSSADAGDYAVAATSGSTVATSASASLTVITQSGTHTIIGHGYVPGGTVTISNTLGYTGTASSLGWQVTLPPGWTFASDGGAAGDVKPAVGAAGTLDWAWTAPPPSPVTFTYTLNVPATETGVKNLTATAIVRAGSSPATTAVTPGPLAIDVAPPVHSADLDLNFRLSLVELTRVIELFNTRNGPQRTGCYQVDPGTEDGFAAEPARANGATVTLTRYHSADSNRDGKLSLFELTRVIELYNYRSGTTRTGQYHVQGGTEDGFAPGP